MSNTNIPNGSPNKNITYEITFKYTLYCGYCNRSQEVVFVTRGNSGDKANLTANVPLGWSYINKEGVITKPPPLQVIYQDKYTSSLRFDGYVGGKLMCDSCASIKDILE